MLSRWWDNYDFARFSALQRAEIAEMCYLAGGITTISPVSVLFNEPKLLKCLRTCVGRMFRRGFSALQRAEIAEILFSSVSLMCSVLLRFNALQRAEIAEIPVEEGAIAAYPPFQCSSTSRNC